MNRRQRWLLLAVLLLAVGLRFFRLDGQSLWYDEGTSVALAGRSLPIITGSAAADIHPPFYYYLLHGWTSLAGFSPTAVRSLSALIGTTLVALTWVLGRQLFGSTVGLTAAFLAAVSPFQVYYSQETRMYVLVAMLGALSMVLAVELARRWVLGIGYWILATKDPISNTQYPIPNTQYPILWIAYVIVSALVLYTHYFGFTVLLAENLAIGLWVLFGWRRRLGFAVRWAVAQVAVALLYVPWLALTWRQLQAWPAVSQPFSLTFLLRDTLRVYSLGLSIEPTITPAVWTFGLLLILGLIGDTIHNSPSEIRNSKFEIRNPRRLPWLITALYLIVPIACMYLLSLRRPLYNPKFLLLATPPFHLLIALGIHHASRITHHAS
ncbi:MAG: glycosyltransferase family 39 protein, partial [Anaerolineae bacterium]